MYYMSEFILKKYVGEGAYPYEHWKDLINARFEKLGFNPMSSRSVIGSMFIITGDTHREFCRIGALCDKLKQQKTTYSLFSATRVSTTSAAKRTHN